jgi:DNA helicase-2/ATP-dependent DNA helicase PcrA
MVRARKHETSDVVQEEEQLLQTVQAAVRRAERPAEFPDYDRDLVQLRDALSEEKLPDDQASLVEMMDRIAALSATRERYVAGQIDHRSPYFAHLRLRTDEGERRDILIGKHTFVSDNIRIVDWRNAPISLLFYRYREGEPFTEEIAGKELCGEIELRRTVTIIDGHLMRIGTPNGVFLHTTDGWRNVTDQQAALSGGAGTAARPDNARPFLGSLEEALATRPDKHLPEIAALLDREQFDLLRRPGDGVLLIRGGAGSGKTTVGLHRLAFLHFSNRDRFREQHMLVVVFSQALAGYISRVLPALGLPQVPVATLHGWAREMRRLHFRNLHRAYSQDTPAAVIRFKTQRAMVPMLTDAAAQAPGADPATLFDELFTDRRWMRSGVTQYAPGMFSDAEIGQIHRWCADQHFRRAEGVTTDQESNSTDDEAEQPCYDEEDDMIFLRLYQLLRGPLLWRGRRRLRYDHIFLDEAQDFSPLELQVLFACARDQALTLAADAAQTITDKDFTDFDQILPAIGQNPRAISLLRVSYRCTREIMTFANDILGDAAPAEPVLTTRTGAPVELFRCGGRGEAMTFLADTLKDLMLREPNASVAVLARDIKQADEAYEALARTDLENLHMVRDQDFSFGPGIEVTDVSQTKGLEFDYVVLLNVDRHSYPTTLTSRHLLHVGATRAIHQLWLIVWGPPAVVLPAWLPIQIAG